MYHNIYPAFEEIREDLSKDELIELIEMALDTGDMQESINDFVEAKYQTEKDIDGDFIYEQYKDNLLSA